MSYGDVYLKDQPISGASTETWTVQAGAYTILPGEPVKQFLPAGSTVVKVTEGEGVIGSSTLVGIAIKTSTQTSGSNGYVIVHLFNPLEVYAVKATSSTAVDTQAEIDALRGKALTFKATATSTGTAYTVNTASTVVAGAGLIVTGGNPNTGEIYFRVRNAVTPW